MPKMKISGSRVVDIGETLKEIEEELEELDHDCYAKEDPYSKGMHDELRWIRNKLRSLPEVRAESPYEKTFGGKA